MDYKIITSLLEKYFDGTTSLQEETQLKNYFSSNDVDPKLVQYKPLFEFWEEEASIELDDSFDDKILERN